MFIIKCEKCNGIIGFQPDITSSVLGFACIIESNDIEKLNNEISCKCPNEETEQAIKEARNRDGIKVFVSEKDLFNKLGI